MTLYLVHHGEATPEAEDPERPLTRRGREDVARLAAFLARADVRVPRIEHSAKRRAADTARILAEALNPPGETSERTGLGPNDPVEPLAAELEARAEDAMLVGHVPHLERLVALLLARAEGPAIVGFTPGTVARLERAATWSVRWVLPPAVLR